MTDAEIEALDAEIDEAGAVREAAVHRAQQARAQKPHPWLRVVARRPSNSASAPTLGTREAIRRQNPGEKRGPPDPAEPPTDPELWLEAAIWGRS